MNAFSVDPSDKKALIKEHKALTGRFKQLSAANLNLDLTRGKPCTEQLKLSNRLDGILVGDYYSDTHIDTRNYGGLDGLTEAKTLFAEVLGVDAKDMLIGGNSSLTLMYQTVLFAYLFGLNGPASAWKEQASIKFICPVPGYDRHFSICEQLGIEMITVAMDDNGPIMDEVEQLLENDKSIKGMWCVPRFSNPSGIVYSDDTVERIAKLGQISSKDFYVFWDNAYAIHTIDNTANKLAPIMQYCKQYHTEDHVIQYGSTSKVTFAGAGLAYMAASSTNLSAMKKHLAITSIGPDKINQLRHVKFFGDQSGLLRHMHKHAALLKPRFDIVTHKLMTHFGNSDLLQWTQPKGGYFVTVDTQPGLAKKVISLAAELGVKLTPAGATFPYGNDPQDKNIRIAPSFPTLDEIDQAMDVFVLCVKLATVENMLA